MKANHCTGKVCHQKFYDECDIKLPPLLPFPFKLNCRLTVFKASTAMDIQLCHVRNHSMVFFAGLFRSVESLLLVYMYVSSENL